MAILLAELNESVEMLLEDSPTGKKFTINGIFMQAEQVNRNGRIYPLQYMKREVDKYVNEYVKENRALGELSHPQNRISIDPERASHMITELKMEGNDVVGKAVILSTPMGKIVKSLMEDGVKMGVSSRALGSVKKRQDGINEVQSDFSLRCIDAVLDPSAPNAFVQGLFENKEWVCENGIWSEKQIEESKSIIRKAPAKLVNEITLQQFEKYLKSL